MKLKREKKNTSEIYKLNSQIKVNPWEGDKEILRGKETQWREDGEIHKEENYPSLSKQNHGKAKVHKWKKIEKKRLERVG